MNLTPDNRKELRRLAVEPMRSAGLDYADPALASDMLARMNYYPSLVQVFGQQIVESIGRRPPTTSTGPRWLLNRENLFEGEAAEKISVQIRERFQWTLNLDLRYELIAKSIALHRLDTTGGETAVLARGLSAAEIDDIILWPERLARPGRADLEELLREMVDLGVLGEYPGNRFGLRNAQVAQMLGERQRLETDLTMLLERDDDPAYDAAIFYGLLRPQMPEARAPLSDRQLERLFKNKSRGLKLVIGEETVVGPDLALRIKAGAQIWLENENVQLTIPSEGDLRRLLDRSGQKRAVIVIDGPWSQTTAESLSRQEKVTSGQILVIWCMVSRPDTTPTSSEIFRAGAWTEPMLRHWLRDEGLSPALDDRATRAAIMRASGGSPARLFALRKKLNELSTYAEEERLDQLEVWARAHPISADNSRLGAVERQVLDALTQLGDAITSIADLKDLCPSAEDSHLAKLEDCGFLSMPATENGIPTLTPLGRLVVT